jgi:hypothetical protein
MASTVVSLTEAGVTQFKGLKLIVQIARKMWE